MVTQAMITAPQMASITELLKPLASTITDLSKSPVPQWKIHLKRQELESAPDKAEPLVRTTTHNGIFTAQLPDGHKTFKIKTQRKNANFMPDKRIVYLLTGSNPDDYESWQSFGLMTAMGVVLWKSKQSRKWKHYANLLSKPENYPAVKWNMDEFCMYCNRMLTTPRSAELGYGPTCAGKRRLPY